MLNQLKQRQIHVVCSTYRWGICPIESRFSGNNSILNSSNTIYLQFVQVKGKADLSIYNRSEEGSQHEPRTPPLTTQSQSTSLPKTPSLGEPSDRAKKNELSEREVLNLLSQLKMDWGGTFRKNTSLLKRVQQIVNEKINERIEIDNRRQGNIKVIFCARTRIYYLKKKCASVCLSGLTFFA